MNIMKKRIILQTLIMQKTAQIQQDVQYSVCMRFS